MTVISAYNIKGGVGKTATAVNLAWLCADMGHRTLLWDLDPQGASTFYFRIKMKIRDKGQSLLRGKKSLKAHIRQTDFEGLDLLRASFSNRAMEPELAKMKKSRKRIHRACQLLAQEYDFIFLDCPPSISLVATNVFIASDALVVPTIPTPLSLRTLQQLRRHLRGESFAKPVVLPFFRMIDRRKLLHKQVCEKILASDSRMLKTLVPYASVIEQMGLFRAPVPVYAAKSAAADAYRALWDELYTTLRDHKTKRSESSDFVSG